VGKRNANGEGTIYHRKDGRYEAAAYFLTTAGIRKRIRVYGTTRAEVAEKLVAVQAQAHRGIPVPDRMPRLGNYLDYWLKEVVKPNRRPKTHELYELTVRLYLRPALGTRPLNKLSVPMVQTFLNQQLAQGHSLRKVQVMRTVLSAALTRAMREEVLSRNVARLVELPAWIRGEVHPWTADEAKQFLSAARSHPLYPAYLLLMLYGLRRGEVLGLRWQDIDVNAGEIHIRQQLQRLNTGLQQGPVKTNAGRRDLPLVGLARDALQAHHARQLGMRLRAGSLWAGTESQSGLVFTSATGRPEEPGNFVRSFHELCAKHRIRRIKLHHIRHTAATLLKNLGVPARDAQVILGHSQISVTQEIYQHADMASRKTALDKVEALFLRAPNSDGCRQPLPSLLGATPVDEYSVLGGPGGTRTLDILLKRSSQNSQTDSLTDVLEVLKERTEQWILGQVAVTYCRQILPTHQVRRPRELWSVVQTWLDEPSKEPPCGAA
jgi:integrase